MKIKTNYDHPPIADRSHDWSAIDDDTYDGAPECRCIVGRGPTEQAAIDDLIARTEERDYENRFD